MDIGKDLDNNLKVKIDKGIPLKLVLYCLSPVNFASCEDLLLRKSIHIIILIIK